MASSVMVRDNTLSQNVAGTLSLGAFGHLVSFVPAAPLAPSHFYQVSLTAVRDLTGNSLSLSALLGFTTTATADTAPPQVLGLSPPDSAADVPLNAQVEIRFDEPVQTRSLDHIGLSANGEAISVLASLRQGNQIVTLRPTTLLSPNTVFTVMIGPVQDLAGNTLVTPLQSNFTTGLDAVLLAPMVTGVNPAAQATLVLRHSTIAVEFSEAINPLTITATTFTVSSTTGGQVEGSLLVTPGEQQVIFTPAVALEPATTYTVQLNGISDVTGQAVPFFSSSFTTVAP